MEEGVVASPLAKYEELNLRVCRPRGLRPEDAQRILDGNSPNHSGRGQNVLFSDLHVGWHSTRRLGPHDADMFLNDERRPGPGVRLMDAALLPGLFPFAGR